MWTKKEFGRVVAGLGAAGANAAAGAGSGSASVRQRFAASATGGKFAGHRGAAGGTGVDHAERLFHYLAGDWVSHQADCEGRANRGQAGIGDGGCRAGEIQTATGGGSGRGQLFLPGAIRGRGIAPAEVHITLTDTNPVLITPNDVEFGQLLPGGSARRSLVLQNIGGGLAEGTVQVPDGWTLDGDAAYHIGAGGKQTFTLIFQPSAVGRYTGDVEYSSNPERATDLNGEVVAPIAVTSGTVELREAGEMRIGTIHVENRTDGARTFKVTAGPALDADGAVTAPANGAADILVRAKAGTGEVDDRVTVEGNGFKAEVPVHAISVAAMERMQGEERRYSGRHRRRRWRRARQAPRQPARRVASASPVSPAAPEPPPASEEAGMPVMNLLPPCAGYQCAGGARAGNAGLGVERGEGDGYGGVDRVQFQRRPGGAILSGGVANGGDRRKRGAGGVMGAIHADGTARERNDGGGANAEPAAREALCGAAGGTRWAGEGD